MAIERLSVILPNDDTGDCGRSDGGTGGKMISGRSSLQLEPQKESSGMSNASTQRLLLYLTILILSISEY